MDGREKKQINYARALADKNSEDYALAVERFERMLDNIDATDMFLLRNKEGPYIDLAERALVELSTLPLLKKESQPDQTEK